MRQRSNLQKINTLVSAAALTLGGYIPTSAFSPDTEYMDLNFPPQSAPVCCGRLTCTALSSVYSHGNERKQASAADRQARESALRASLEQTLFKCI